MAVAHDLQHDLQKKDPFRWVMLFIYLFILFCYPWFY